MTPLRRLPKNVRDLGKLIVAKGFKKLPKVPKIAQSGHTGLERKREREIEGDCCISESLNLTTATVEGTAYTGKKYGMVEASG